MVLPEIWLSLKISFHSFHLLNLTFSKGIKHACHGGLFRVYLFIHTNWSEVRNNDLWYLFLFIDRCLRGSVLLVLASSSSLDILAERWRRTGDILSYKRIKLSVVWLAANEPTTRSLQNNSLTMLSLFIQASIEITVQTIKKWNIF